MMRARSTTALVLFFALAAPLLAADLAPRRVYVYAANPASMAATQAVKTALAGQTDPLGPVLVEKRELADVFTRVSETASRVSLFCELAEGGAFTLSFDARSGIDAFARDLLLALGERLPAREQRVTELVTERTVEERVFTETEGVTVTLLTAPGATATVKGRDGFLVADAEGIIRVEGVPQNSSIAGTVILDGFYDTPFSAYVGEASLAVDVALEAIPIWRVSLSTDIANARWELEWGGLDPGYLELYVAGDSNIPWMILDPAHTLLTARLAAGAALWFGRPGDFVRTRLAIGAFSAIDFAPGPVLSPWQTFGIEFPMRAQIDTGSVSVFLQFRPSIHYSPAVAAPAGATTVVFNTGYYYYAWFADGACNSHYTIPFLGPSWFFTLPEIQIGMTISL